MKWWQWALVGFGIYVVAVAVAVAFLRGAHVDDPDDDDWKLT